MHSEKNIGTLLGQPDPQERQRGVQLLAENFRLGNQLGTTLVVLHLWNWPELDDDLNNNLSVLRACYDYAEEYGIELAIETIPGRHYDPLSNIYRALECDERTKFAFDTEFLANYQQLDTVFTTDWLWRENRVHHVHIKDSNGHPFVDGIRRYLHPGEGDVDFTRFFTQLRGNGFSGNISLEAPAIDIEDDIDIQQLHDSLAFIQSFIW
jgi:sugar phosphate isomerase/epimerase